MASFSEAIEFVLHNEGGYSDHENDRGGATKYGVTWFTLLDYQRNTKDLRGKNVADISIDDAKRIYQSMYWQDRFSAIESQAVATKLLDMCVNFGVPRGVEILQRAVNRCGWSLEADGIFGPNTLHAVNLVKPEQLLTNIVKEQTLKYARIVRANPSQSVFLVGWISRAWKVPA